MVQFKDLEHRLIKSVSGLEVGSTRVCITVHGVDGPIEYCLWHQQDCCESVSIAEIVGDVGASNGYYSESVDFDRVTPED